MTLPTVLSGEAPHFLRAIGVLPVVLLLPALTLDETLRKVSRRRESLGPQPSAGLLFTLRRLARRELLPLSVLALLVSSTALSARDYFGRRTLPALRLSGFDYVGSYVHDPICGYAFFAPFVDLARDINSAPGTVYADRAYWKTISTTAVRFLVPNSRRLVQYDAGSTLATGILPLTLIAWPSVNMAPMVNVVPSGALVTIARGPRMLDERGQMFDTYVRWSAEPLPRELPDKLARPLARFVPGLDLVDLQAVPGGDYVDVRLLWSRPTHAPAPAVVVVEGLDATGQPAGRQEDAVGTVYYPPSLWRPGSVTVQHVRLPVAADGQAPRSLRVGLADLASGRELGLSATNAFRRGNALIVPAGSEGNDAAR
jgi:hypothetical protein